MGVEKQSLIFSSCLSPGRIKKLHTFINFCLKFGMRTTYLPVKGTKSKHQKLWAQCTLSTSWSRKGNDRSTTVEPDSCRFDIGRFRAKPTNYERRLHRSDTFAYRSAHNNLFPPYATRNPKVKKDIERTISTQWYGIRLKLVNGFKIAQGRQYMNLCGNRSTEI